MFAEACQCNRPPPPGFLAQLHFGMALHCAIKSPLACKAQVACAYAHWPNKNPPLNAKGVAGVTGVLVIVGVACIVVIYKCDRRGRLVLCGQ